ncbi:MAG: hypothetical protein IPH55_08795 [Betaproteobacteria bacterium]|nr:hypothetical protein [Betaproteobacteria bacterium]
MDLACGRLAGGAVRLRHRPHGTGDRRDARFGEATAFAEFGADGAPIVRNHPQAAISGVAQAATDQAPAASAVAGTLMGAITGALIGAAAGVPAPGRRSVQGPACCGAGQPVRPATCRTTCSAATTRITHSACTRSAIRSLDG